MQVACLFPNTPTERVSPVKVAIASGKGGTGKTTVAASLATVWPQPVYAVDLDVEEPKTKLLAKQLGEYGVDNVLIVSAEVGRNLYLAARNLHKVDVRDVDGIDPVSLIGHEKVMVTVDAVKKFEEMLG